MSNWTLFDNFRLKQHNGNALNLAAGGATVKVALLTATTAPNTASDTLFSGYTTEVTGTNYTAGGLSVSAGQSCLLASGVVTFTTSTAITWAQSATGFSTARYAVIYDSVTSKLIAWGDLGSAVGNVAGSLTITLDASGIWTSP